MTAVAVVGAGFSGTLLALHLLRRCPPWVRVHLIEKNRSFGRGLAYSTGNPSHLLNVPAARMSAFSDQPRHFVDWLHEHGPGEAPADASSFIERNVFGLYIRHLLNAELKSAGKDRLVLSRGEVTGIETGESELGLCLEGRRIAADIAVLAVGNFPPEVPPVTDPSFYDGPWYRPDPWAADTLTGLDPAAPVLLIGTGLTMVDTVISLLDQGHAGPIVALSRRGLVPRRHAPAKSLPLLGRPVPTTITALLRFMRDEVGRAERDGGDWRSVVDGLRPALQDIWQRMDAPKSRSLRAPSQALVGRASPPRAGRRRRPYRERAGDRGSSMSVRRGSRDYCIADGAVEVSVRPRNAGAPSSYRVARVINCSGPGCDYDRIRDPLVRHLLEEGQIRPDPLRLGLDVTPQCALLNREGEISRRLYAVGPATKAVFWEMTSVPDIRRQCETVAAHIAGLVTTVEAKAWPPVRRARAG